MLKKLSLCLLLASYTLQANAETVGSSQDKVLFIVDETPVMESTYRLYFQAKGYRQPDDSQQQKLQQTKVANELINIVLLSQQAKIKKLDDSYEVKQATELSSKTILSKALIKRYLDDINISEEDYASAYVTIQQEAQNRAELKASYILLNSEKEAQDIIGKLNKGENFQVLAKSHSTENFSNQNDADMGWVTLDTQEQEIAHAMSKLAIGQFTQQPVKTRFGWHVIRIDDKKTPEVPPLNDIKPKLGDLIKQHKLREKVQQLRATATIKISDAK